MGGTGQAELILDTAHYIPLYTPPSLWHASSLWLAAIAGRWRRLCQRGENLRPLHPSCSCGESSVHDQSSSAIKELQQSGGRMHAKAAEGIHWFYHSKNYLPHSYITMMLKHNMKSEVNELGERKLCFSPLSLNKTCVICVIVISCRGITVVSQVSGRLQHKCVRVCYLVTTLLSPSLWLTYMRPFLK